MQETAERAKRYLPRSLQNARLRRVERAKQRQVPGSDPRVSYKLILSPEQIKALKSSSHQKGIDVGGDSGQLEQLELAPVDVYDRFQRYLLSLHPAFVLFSFRPFNPVNIKPNQNCTDS